MDGVYREHDRMLGELLGRAGAGTTVLLLSDHGFYSDHRRPVIKAGTTPAERAALESSWHRPEGVLVLAGPGVRAPAGDAPQVGAAPTLLDIAPTVLALLGLPMGADMDGRVLAEWLDPACTAPGTVPSWDAEPGEAGLHPATMRQDPFEAQDALNQLIELGYMPEMGGNTKVLLDLTRRETQFNLGVVYMTTGRAMLAVPVFQALVTAHPDETRYGLTLAQCLLTLSRAREAVGVLEAVIAHHPSALEPQMLLVGALAGTGECARAGEMVRALERAHASRPELAVGFGDMCSAVGRWQDAEEYYARATKANPSDPAVHVARARAALGRGEYEPSAEHALNALDLRQSLPDAHYTLGVALAWLGQHEHAITSFDIALTWEPRMIDAHRFQAMLRGLTGGGDAARAHRARVAELRESARQAGADAPPEPAWGPAAWAAHTGNTEG